MFHPDSFLKHSKLDEKSSGYYNIILIGFTLIFYASTYQTLLKVTVCATSLELRLFWFISLYLNKNNMDISHELQCIKMYIFPFHLLL